MRPCGSSPDRLQEAWGRGLQPGRSLPWAAVRQPKGAWRGAATARCGGDCGGILGFLPGNGDHQALADLHIHGIRQAVPTGQILHADAVFARDRPCRFPGDDDVLFGLNRGRLALRCRGFLGLGLLCGFARKGVADKPGGARCSCRDGGPGRHGSWQDQCCPGLQRRVGAQGVIFGQFGCAESQSGGDHRGGVPLACDHHLIVREGDDAAGIRGGPRHGLRGGLGSVQITGHPAAQIRIKAGRWSA